MFMQKKLLDTSRLDRRMTKLEWIDEQSFKKPRDCELCKYNNKQLGTEQVRCRFHKRMK